MRITMKIGLSACLLVLLSVGVLVYMRTVFHPEKTLPTTSLDGRTYRLASFNNTSIPLGEQYVLSFLDGRLHIRWCNTMSGEYTLAEGQLSSLLVSTKMWCSLPAGIMEMEQAWGSMLALGAVVTHASAEMILEGAGNIFVFVRQ